MKIGQKLPSNHLQFQALRAKEAKKSARCGHHLVMKGKVPIAQDEKITYCPTIEPVITRKKHQATERKRASSTTSLIREVLRRVEGAFLLLDVVVAVEIFGASSVLIVATLVSDEE